MEQSLSFLPVAVVALFCAVVGAGGALLFARRRLPPLGAFEQLRQTRSDLERDLAVERERTSRIPILEQDRADIQRKLNDAQTDLATLRANLDQERHQTDEKLRILTDAKEAMTREFQVLANDLMARHGEALTKQNSEQLSVLLTPLRDRLSEFEKGLQNAQTESTKERATLGEQIRQLSEQSARMTSETTNLTRALKGEVQTQGAWGEMILASLLKNSGLRDGQEYETQSSHTTDEGRRLTPDVIVKLPGGQRVIVDAKVSLVAFEAHVNAETQDARDGFLAEHLASMRGQIKRLASKEYQTIDRGGLDYVIMFVPIEGALALALQKEPDLTSYAVQNNVAIATPTTLMVVLRTVENVWKVERRNQNAEAMADRAGRLYNKFVAFVEDLRGVGQRLQQAQVAYDSAIGKLQTGSGNLIGQAEKLKELGAKTAKRLPDSVIADATHEDDAETTIAPDEPADELTQGLLTFAPPDPPPR